MSRANALSLLWINVLGLIVAIISTLAQHLSLGEYGLTTLFTYLIVNIALITWLVSPREGNGEESK